MGKGQAGKGSAEKEKQTEKEKKALQQHEIEDTIKQIRALIRQEQGADPDGPEWNEFEAALTGFLNGDIKGNAWALSVQLYDNIQTFSKGRRTFIQSAKGQQIAQKMLEAMKKVPGAETNPESEPLLNFLSHVARGEMKEEKKEKGKAKKDILEDWVTVEKPVKGAAPIAITVEEGKKDQDEAMEALKEFHKKMGLADPEKLKKAIKSEASGASDELDKEAKEDLKNYKHEKHMAEDKAEIEKFEEAKRRESISLPGLK